MQTRQGNTLQSLRTVHAFLDENASAIPNVMGTGACRRLGDVIAELSAFVAEQSGSAFASQGATLKQRALREELLRGHMAPISRITRIDLPHVPDLAPFRMPRGRPTAEKLAAAALGMAKAAAPFSHVFVAAGLPTDFIAQLENAAEALRTSLSDRSQHRGRRSGATKGLRSSLSHGRKLVHVLDSFVQRALKNDPALLANWNTVKRVRRVPGRSAAMLPIPLIPEPSKVVTIVPPTKADAVSHTTARPDVTLLRRFVALAISLTDATRALERSAVRRGGVGGANN